MIFFPHFLGAVLHNVAQAFKLSTPYLSQLLLGIVALFALLKDWRDYGKLSKKFGKWVPFTLAVATFLITLLSLNETYTSRVEQASKEATISQLSNHIDQLRKDNQQTADGFRNSFARLYGRFSDLQSKVQNADLLKELKQTKEELAATQAKLTPVKVTPIASFPTLDAALVPITRTTATISGDSVDVRFQIFNLSDVNMETGAVLLRICEGCTYASEPSGFAKIAGAPDCDREHHFDRIWAKTALEQLTARVKPPPNTNGFGIGVFVTCDNCVPTKQQMLWVTVQ